MYFCCGTDNYITNQSIILKNLMSLLVTKLKRNLNTHFLIKMTVNKKYIQTRNIYYVGTKFYRLCRMKI